MATTTQASSSADARLIQDVSRQVALRVVGQEYMIDRLLISILTGGHVLLEGVPGLAKTLTVRTLAETISTSFSRIQFTPDLLPADVVGTQIYDQSTGKFTTTIADATVMQGTLQVGASVPNIVGSRGGNAALASLLTALATEGLITDGTTP